MPLITITTRKEWVPASEDAVDNPFSNAVYQLGAALPGMISASARSLRLDPYTTAAGVQVDFQAFHPRAINAPPIWIKIELTEAASETTDVLTGVRDIFIDLVAHAIEEYFLTPTDFALDIFWGPGAGCIVTERTTITW